MIMRLKRTAAVSLAAAAIAALAGCTTPFSHGAAPAVKPTAAATATATAKQAVSIKTKTGPACPGQAAWSLRAEPTLRSLYADTGALSADAASNNLPGVTKAGRKLASDALAAATLPMPPADATSWKTLTAAYAAAGTALAADDTTGAVPQLEAGNSAISTFSSAVAKCLAATP